MAPLEPWEKVLVDQDNFPADPHGKFSCTLCHAGQNVSDKEAAHVGMVSDPSAPPTSVCNDCHYKTAMAGNGLHADLQGYLTAIEARGGVHPQYDAQRIEKLMATYDTHCGTCHTTCSDCHYFPSNTNSEETVLVKQDVVNEKLLKVNHLEGIKALRASPTEQAMVTMFGNHCSSCHASCGDCHISQPGSVGGGFVEGHVIMKTPSMSQNCVACHGSRVGNEYLGKHEDIPGDAHFRIERMNCMSCHSEAQMHGTDAACTQCHSETDGFEKLTKLNRYAGEQSPSCESCHPEMGAWNDTNQNHIIHKDKLACQVCHSVSYTSCDSCHVAISDKTGNPFYETEGDYLSFFIGKNPSPNFHRPYEYVVVRHVPTDPDSYSFYGDNLLPDFNAKPTWVYATPHNIQKETPQNKTCNACHGNADIFLTKGNVNPEEVNANKDVIVDQVPPLVEETLPSP